MVEDWFSLKDECPYAKFHDQQRLYIALLHMVLKYEGEEEEVDRNDAMSSQTDCMQFCMSENSAKHISHCFGASDLPTTSFCSTICHSIIIR